MMENFAKSPPTFANKQPGFSAHNSKDNFTSNFNFKLPPFWSHNADSWLALCEAKFTIADIEAPVLKFMTILEALTTGQFEKLCDIPKPQDPDCYPKLCTQIRPIFFILILHLTLAVWEFTF